MAASGWPKMPNTPHSSLSLSWGLFVVGPHPDLCLADLRSLGFGGSDFLLGSGPRLTSSSGLCSSLLEIRFQGAVPNALGLAHGDIDDAPPID